MNARQKIIEAIEGAQLTYNTWREALSVKAELVEAVNEALDSDAEKIETLLLFVEGALVNERIYNFDGHEYTCVFCQAKSTIAPLMAKHSDDCLRKKAELVIYQGGLAKFCRDQETPIEILESRGENGLF